jgi:hypothetical protein
MHMNLHFHIEFSDLPVAQCRCGADLRLLTSKQAGKFEYCEQRERLLSSISSSGWL